MKYLNVDVDTMKQLTLKQLQNGLPVWMGCDVSYTVYVYNKYIHMLFAIGTHLLGDNLDSVYC